jgi:TP901-1 family phage major tail protein
MAAGAGRTIIFRWGTGSPLPAVAGLREKGVTLGGEAIDITTDSSLGWRELLDVPSTQSVDLSCSGVTMDDVLRNAWFNGERMGSAEFVYPDGGVISGTFYLQEYSDTGSHEDAITFEATFASSGTVTYVSGSPV